MVNNLELQSFLADLAKGIAELFGPNCEVTVHDLSHSYENTIVAIENGQVTGRKVGDAASEKALEVLKSDGNPENRYNYPARTKSGRMLKCSTIYIRDVTGRAVGLFGINYDISDLVMAGNAISQLTGGAGSGAPDEVATITNNVEDLLDQLIAESHAIIGKPVAMMTKDEKVRAIQFLDQKGAFLIKKAGDKITRYYDISKYTLYNYLDTPASQNFPGGAGCE